MKIAKSNKVVRFPRPVKSVKTLLETVLKQSQTVKLKRCVIVVLDEEGEIMICHTPSLNSEFIGLLEMAKLKFWDQQ